MNSRSSNNSNSNSYSYSKSDNTTSKAAKSNITRATLFKTDFFLQETITLYSKKKLITLFVMATVAHSEKSGRA